MEWQFPTSRVARSARLLKNAEAALISAIGIYNKPAFGYRKGTFTDAFPWRDIGG